MAFAVYGIAVVTAPALAHASADGSPITSTWRWIFFINIPVGLLSLFLTNFIVDDPPYFVKERKERRNQKLEGGLLGHYFCRNRAWFPANPLDKGEREDWWASNFTSLHLDLAAAG